MSSTRHRLIQLLVDTAEKDAYISGQQLSDQLGISRTAVWKHMKDLEHDGFGVKAVPNKGYRIEQFPNTLSVNAIQWGLTTKWLGQSIIHKQTTTSTQFTAHEAAQSDAKHGTVVVANEQTAGRGRLNRKWQSTKDKGIWMSIILRPKILPHLAPQLTLLTACAIAKVLRTDTSVDAQIKWPNDILINGKKVVGILTEMQAEQDQIQYVIVGIGINVNHTDEDLNDPLTERATSLYQETGLTWSLVQIIHRILDVFEDMYEIYLKQGFKPIKILWEQHAYRMNQLIRVTTHHHSEDVQFCGIADDGALLIEQAGDVRKIYSAEIDWDEKQDVAAAHEYGPPTVNEASD
ncbi:biotin--[acetyl-CoA-carboxylase] ligase [Lentibacillus saliphilus]|uniref:biotin--[acetyl-CoA-carboxylase] ligase n=1 Tax=Lentibacillus saliphilus TaxID=2737028 RepID=UPI001C2F570B|nr:biotin--[acetyl-CoA-carboxylase] ligase [Lentibacillus saliphilus]